MVLLMTSRLELILNVIIQTEHNWIRKDNAIPTYSQGELYIQLKLLYKTYQPHELCSMPPLDMRWRVSIPESGVDIML